MPKKREKQESELEEEIKESEKKTSEDEEESEENINDSQFHEFLHPLTESSAPVLERVARAPEQLNLEQGFGFTLDTETPTSPNYAVGERREEITYEPPILRPLNLSENLPRQELLNPLVDMGLDFQNNTQSRRIESEFREESKRLPFETREERKYREIKL